MLQSLKTALLDILNEIQGTDVNLIIELDSFISALKELFPHQT